MWEKAHYPTSDGSSLPLPQWSEPTAFNTMQMEGYVKENFWGRRKAVLCLVAVPAMMIPVLPPMQLGEENGWLTLGRYSSDSGSSLRSCDDTDDGHVFHVPVYWTDGIGLVDYILWFETCVTLCDEQCTHSAGWFHSDLMYYWLENPRRDIDRETSALQYAWYLWLGDIIEACAASLRR